MNLSERTSPPGNAPVIPTLLLFAVPGRTLWVNLLLCFQSWKTEVLEKCLPLLLRAVVEKMNCGVAGNVRGGHLSGGRNHKIPAFLLLNPEMLCGMGWDPGFVVPQGWLAAVQISGKARQEIPSPYCLFSCLTPWVACFLDVLKQMTWSRQNLAFSSCSCEGREYWPSIVIYWNSPPFFLILNRFSLMLPFPSAGQNTPLQRWDNFRGGIPWAVRNSPNNVAKDLMGSVGILIFLQPEEQWQCQSLLVSPECILIPWAAQIPNSGLTLSTAGPTCSISLPSPAPDPAGKAVYSTGVWGQALQQDAPVTGDLPGMLLEGIADQEHRMERCGCQQPSVLTGTGWRNWEWGFGWMIYPPSHRFLQICLSWTIPGGRHVRHS